MSADRGVTKASDFTSGGSNELGTGFYLFDVPLWTSNPLQDLDKDGLNDEWEKIAVQSLSSTLVFDEGEDLFNTPGHKAALFTRVTPVEVDGQKKIIFLNKIGFTEDYGTPKEGAGDHNGDTGGFQTVWSVQDNSSITLDSLYTRGHVDSGLPLISRGHATYRATPGGANSIEFTENGSIKIYVESDKHSTWSSVALHDAHDTPYPIDGGVVTRVDTFNVGEPWFHPSPSFTNDLNEFYLFPRNPQNKGSIERVWNDPDGQFCGGLTCDSNKKGKGIGAFLGSLGGAIIGGMILGPVGAAGGAIGGGIGGAFAGKEIEGKSPDPIGDGLGDQAIDKLFPDQNITAKGVDFYADGVELSEFNLVIDRLKTLDGDGLDGGIIDDRGNFYAKVTINDTQYKTSKVTERDEDKGIGIPLQWGFHHPDQNPDNPDPIIRIKIEILDDDTFFKGGKDDRADINDIDGEKDLHFTYDRVTGQLMLTDKNFVPIEGRQPITSADGRFTFKGEYNDKGNPKDDQVEISFTINPPETARRTPDGDVQLSIGPNSIKGSSPDETVVVEHISGEGGNERVAILAQEYQLQKHDGAFSQIIGFAGNGDDSLIFDGVKSPVQIGGGAGNDTIKIINTPQGKTSNSELDGGAGNDTLHGGAGNDYINGGQGNDELFGGHGEDHIVGGSGEDTIIAGHDADIVSGGAGSDTIDAGAGNDIIGGGDAGDTIDGGSGDDLILGDASLTSTDEILLATPNDGADDSIWAGSGDDTVLGEWGDDTIDGGTGDDLLLGGVGNDTIDGGSGNDTIEGNTGDDFLDGGLGDDLLTGGNGNDTYVVDSTNDVVVEIASAAAGGGTDEVKSSVDFSLADTAVENLVLTGVDNLQGIGNELSNTIVGNSGNNRIEGGAGDDHLFGQEGDDHLLGQAGDDYLNGGPGSDILDGGVGFDKASYADAPGPILINLTTGTNSGAAGGDTLISIEGVEGSEDSDLIFGDELDNWFSGLGGDDILDGRAGNDALIGGDGRDRLTGGDGDDSLNGDTGNDSLDGNAGNDSLEGGAGDDNLDGGNGQDSLRGGSGNDFLEGGDGDDDLEGEAGIDFLEGGNGNDLLNGGDGDDVAYGAEGDDTLLGEAGDDYLEGGVGQDTFLGGAGNDILDGGLGLDIASFEDASEGVTVNLSNETYSSAPPLSLPMANITIAGLSADDGHGTTDSLNSIEIVIGSEHNDTFISSEVDETLVGQAGDDLFVLNGGSNAINGGEGIDTVDYRRSTTGVTIDLVTQTVTNTSINDALDSIENAIGSGFDDTILGEDGGYTLDGDAGNDTLAGGLGDDEIFGGDGNDLIRGDLNRRDTQDEISGGNDILHGGKGNDRIGGKTGDDQLYGDEGNDELWGGLGNDLLVGGQGEDILTGLTGADTFRFNSFEEGPDAITDFDQLQGDKLEILGIGFADDLVKGVLSADAFVLGSSAVDASDRFIYDQSTGSLLFDADGSGTQSVVQVATLSNNAILTHSDIAVV